MLTTQYFDKKKLVGFIKIDHPIFIKPNTHRIFVGYKMNRIVVCKINYGIIIGSKNKCKLGLRLFRITDNIKVVPIEFNKMDSKDIGIYNKIINL
uniref:Uncharacterized protein n=1 Tax=Megaviridae environmental sample TaxID=1737588 RepID=A0A5J6VKJ3_9VIRU|nr:MAG: hypothetical protein [Megaviridae environmental sample]